MICMAISGEDLHTTKNYILIKHKLARRGKNCDKQNNFRSSLHYPKETGEITVAEYKITSESGYANGFMECL